MDTLMFGGNRFSETEDYAETYRKAGGRIHSDDEAQILIHTVHQTMMADYQNPAHYANFRHVQVYVEELLDAMQLPKTDSERLSEAFARHELGTIPSDHCEALHQLRQTHRLGLVSNLWSGKPLFVDTFREAGILDLFDTLVFSSDYACVKPSPRLFQTALDSLGVAAEEVLFVGDDWDRDVLAAQALGMTPVWVDKSAAGNKAEHWVCNITELVR